MGPSLATITARHCHSSEFHASLQNLSQHRQKVFQTSSSIKYFPLSLSLGFHLSDALLGAPICFMTMQSEGKESVSHEGVVKEEGGGKEKQKEEEEEDHQHCTTPTGSGNRIPEIQNCPPAPRKRRRSSPSSSSTLTRRSFTAHELRFFEDTRLQEVDSFFQYISVNRQFSKLKNRSRSV